MMNNVHDSGSVSTAGAVVAGCGMVTPARTGAGVYTLTMKQELDAAQGTVLLTIRGATGFAHAVWTSDSVVTVSTFAVDGTTATDKAFDFCLLRNKAA